MRTIINFSRPRAIWDGLQEKLSHSSVTNESLPSSNTNQSGEEENPSTDVTSDNFDSSTS